MYVERDSNSLKQPLLHTRNQRLYISLQKGNRLSYPDLEL